MVTQENNLIILFDGVCNLCNSSVSFILKNDHKNNFVFTSLQSDAAKEILLHFNPKKNNLDSLILIENDKLFEGSTAVLKIGTHLGWKFKWVYLGYLVPLKLRDTLYYYIAKNRYNWFGKQTDCPIPNKKEKARFL